MILKILVKEGLSIRTSKRLTPVLVLLAGLLWLTDARAQGTIVGKAGVTAGTNGGYSYTDDIVYASPNWTVSSGQVISSGSSGLTYSATVVFYGPPGTATLSFRNGTTVIATKPITVSCPAIVTPAASFSYANNCGSTTITATGTPASGTTWYWQTSPTGTLTTQGHSVPFVVTTPGTYYLRSYSNSSHCFSAEQATTAVTINTLPDAAASPQWVCSGQATSITITNPNNTPGTTFSWSVGTATNTTGASPGSGPAIAQTLTPTDGVNQGTVTYAVTPTAGGCAGTPVNVMATVRPRPQLSNLPASTNICGGTALNFMPAANIAGSAFAWTSSISGPISAGSVSASGTAAITNTPVNTGNVNGTVTYTVTPSFNSCPGTSQNYTVTVKPVPTVAISANQLICSGVAATFTISNPNSVSGTTYSWTQSSTNVTGASNGTGATINQVLSSTNGTSQGTTTYTATAAASGCNSSTAAAVATVNPAPQITNTTQQLNVESCSQSALNFTPAASMAGTTFTWTSSATAGITGNTGGSGAITNTLTNASTTSTGTATYVMTPVANGCNGPAKNYVVTVLPRPVITLPGSQALIYGAPAPILSTNTPAAAYAWKFNGSTISGATSSTYTVTVIGAYTVGTKFTASSAECISSSFTSQPYPVNFVSTTRILKEGVAPSASLYSLGAAEVSQTIAFQDGIGRTFQVVDVGQSTQQTDIISPVAFSKQGSVDTTFLPYASATKEGRFKVNAIRTSAGIYTGSEQQTFYQSTSQVAQDAQPFARTITRTSPDGRVIEQGAPGTAWQPGGGTPRTVRNTLAVNTATVPVRLWKTDGTTTGTYPAKTVAVSITTDENGNQVRTFTNKLGQTVLKQVQIDKTIESVATPWLETYYIFDNYGRIVCQVPPKAMKVLGTAASLNAYHANAAELVYRYVYDVKGRLVEKKVPGAAWEFIVYDNLDRVVLTQDGNLRTSNSWMFIKYDYQNRPVYSGLYVNATQTTRSAVQGLFDVIDYSASPRFETEQVNATYQGYSNSVFPTSGLTVLAASYYDHYDFDRNGTADYTYDNAHLSGIPSVENKMTRGLPTGSRKVIIDAGGAVTANWLISVIFYDKYERPVQVRSNNHLNLTVQDKSSILYDFVRATKSKTTHTGPTTVNITRRYTFDHAGRVVGVYQTIDALPEQQLASYTYNVLGQLTDKKLHNTGGSNFLQSIDYRYNIRGWLTSINNAQLSNDGTLNDDTGDYFGMELAYNTAAGMSNTPYYNGNISAVKWKAQGTGTTGVTDQRSYKYAYDKSDKLETATFQANTGSAWTKEANSLNESMTYDHNGNILTLSRNHNLRGLSGITVTNTAQTIDNLTYTYKNSGKENQVSKVEDAALPAGFNNGTVNGANEYTYSADGSMTKDENKGISTILYNALGQPRQVTFADGRSITYSYAADGGKLRMAVTISGVTTTTDYASGFVYTNNALSFFGSPEGRVVKNGSTYEQQYAIADHQGNTRVLFSSVTPAPYVPQATWEGDANDNASHYSNVVAGNVVSNVAANHTPGGSKVVRMNQTYKIGPAKSLAVYPGDKVELEVWEYHEGSSGFGTTSTPIATLITNVAGVFGGVSGAPDVSGAIYNGVNSAITGFGTGGNQGNARPAAYLNYILFDKNYKVLNAGWQLAPATTFTKQKLSFTTPIDVKEAGFVFVWLSYDDDSNNWVFFDDLKVTHTKYNNMIQYNEYYPFGMQTAGSWTRENVTGNNYLANGGTELNVTSMLYDLDYRNYDPVLARMHQVDPMAAKYSSLTPYNFSFNNPVAFTDRNGADPMPGEPDYVSMNNRIPRGRAVVNHRTVHDQSVFHILQNSSSPLFDMATGGSLMNNLGSITQVLHDAAHLSETAYEQKYATPVSERHHASFAAALNLSANPERVKALYMLGIVQALGRLRYQEYQKVRRKAEAAAMIACAGPDCDKAMSISKSILVADLLRNVPMFGLNTSNPFYQAEAIYADHGWSFLGHEGDGGAFFVLVGRDIGEFFSFREFTQGGISLDGGYGIEIGRVDVTGNPHDFNSEYFYGPREKIFASAGEGFSAGAAFSWSTSFGQTVTTISVNVSFGLSVWFISGGWNQGQIVKE